MSRIFRRLYSATSTASASEAAAEILQRFGNKPISVKEQIFDANQVRLLTLTLGRPSLHRGGVPATEQAPKEGTPIPPGYHLVYFLPTFLEQDLGNDGTDKTLNPLSPYTRRMWAGGELEWTQDPSSILRVGQTVKETTRITSAEGKQMKSGGSLVIAGLEKTFETKNGVALIDRRLIDPTLTVSLADLCCSVEIGCSRRNSRRPNRHRLDQRRRRFRMVCP